MPAKFGRGKISKNTPALLTCETCGGTFPKTDMHIGPKGIDECTDCRTQRTGGKATHDAMVERARARRVQNRRPEDVELERQTADLMSRSDEAHGEIRE